MKILPARVWTIEPVASLLRSGPSISPEQVTGLSSTAHSTNSVTLTWDAEPNAFVYYVYVNGTINKIVPLAGTSTTVTGLTPSTVYSFTVSAVNVILEEGPESAALEVTTDGLSVAAWPVQDADGRIHALPGINLFGSDSYGGSGRHPDATGVTTYIVTSTATTDTGALEPAWGSDTYDCTLEFALRHDPGTTAKQIIIATSGFPTFNEHINMADNPQGCSIWGQFAPSPGFFTRGLTITQDGNSHLQVWHMAFYVGDEPYSNWDYPYSHRDGFRLGIADNDEHLTHCFFINCEFSFTTDEAVDAFYALDDLGFVYCYFGEGFYLDPDGLTNSPDDKRSMGPLLGAAGGEGLHVSVERCVFANTLDRNPWIGTLRSTTGNNLNYNHGGPPEFGPGFGHVSAFQNQYGHLGASTHNIAHTMQVRGPNNSSTMPRHYAYDTHPYASGSGAHIVGHVQHGWTAPANQAAFLRTSGNFNFLASASSAALPSGRETDFSDMYHIAANPLSPTPAEKMAFLDLMEDSCGIQPGARVAGAGRMQIIFNQIRNALNGIAQPSQIRTGITLGINPIGSWFSVPTPVSVNPLNPGTHWHAPLPTVDIDVPYASGTFSNGMSRVGYTPREVWAIEQHWYKGGK